jgi:hypothetical protein
MGHFFHDMDIDEDSESLCLTDEVELTGFLSDADTDVHKGKTD